MKQTDTGLSRQLLLVMRLYLGVIFAYAAYSKLAHLAALPGIVGGFVNNVGLARAPEFYKEFLSAVVVPHLKAFAMLVVASETFVAFSMLTGTLVRLGGVVALFLLTNYMLTKGMWWWDPSSNDGAQSLIAAVVAIGGAGRYVGVDAYLAARWPKGWLW
jgi:uncharacterized membrane protein YphA (DoxX/SURF4 family)